jgi:hypothetical protein
MTTTITPGELAARVRQNTPVRIDARLAKQFLDDWERQGVAHQVTPGEWQLTNRGQAMFGGFANVDSTAPFAIPPGYGVSRERSGVPFDPSHLEIPPREKIRPRSA